MASPTRGRESLASRLLARPDEVMLEAGAGGELLVARIRALLSALVLLLPLIAAAAGASIREVLAGLVGAVIANVMAQVWLALARRRRRHRWLAFATGTYDVTLTSLVLSLLGQGDPVAAVNSLVVWPLYLFAILVTALRNDGRLTLYAGALAIAQYGALAWWVLAMAPAGEALVSPDYGVASVAAQAQRLLLLVMATLLTAAIVYRMQRLVELSGHDGLTGLPNRAWLLQRMPHVFAATRNDGGSLTVALLDVDQLGRINADLGHAGGDRALRHVAANLSAMVDGREVLARIGGQEFVLVLHCPVGSAWERLDRLRRDMAARPFLPERGAAAFLLTFSAGLAAWPLDGATTSALLGAADRRLKEAKAAGRNRVVARDG